MLGEKIAIAAMGRQGMKAAAHVCEEVRSKLAFDLISFDSSQEEINRNAYYSKKVIIPVEYERNMEQIHTGLQNYFWSIRRKLIRLFEGYQAVYIVVGVGGTMSIAAVELQKFLKVHFPTMETYYIGSLPFEAQQDRKTAAVTHDVQKALYYGFDKCDLVKNEDFYKIQKSDYEQAYDDCFWQLTYIVEEMLKIHYNTEDALTYEAKREVTFEDLVAFVQARLKDEYGYYIHVRQTETQTAPVSVLAGIGRAVFSM